MDAIAEVTPQHGLAPFSLKDAPALIERVFPAQKVGIEAQKERKSNVGQTLTALGAYWKGRKPLVLVRACVLASLLPATDDPVGDLELFEALMRMDPEGISRRDAKITAEQVERCPLIADEIKKRHIVFDKADESKANPKWRRFEAEDGASKAERDAARVRFNTDRELIRQQTLVAMSFSGQVSTCERVERVEVLRDAADPLYAGVLGRANVRLGTDASTLPELVQELGVARFGRRPILGDPFAGGGSIPFEAARVGCDVVASDLNPVAAMLTWGALNVLGAERATRAAISAEQARVIAAVDDDITRLGIEHNASGHRAKAYLYCLETVDPRTGWRVPMAPSWVISQDRRCIAKLKAIPAEKRFAIGIVEGVSPADLKKAERGSVVEGQLVYRIPTGLNGEDEEFRVPIGRLRGDGEGPELAAGGRGNRLRRWEMTDVAPREPTFNADASPPTAGITGAWTGGDIWLERLYCIQWMDGGDLETGNPRPRTFFAAPEADDEQREKQVLQIVEENIRRWQSDGLVPCMPIEAGEKTDEPVRTRGWSYWHHLFGPRSLLTLSMIRQHAMGSAHAPSLAIALARTLDRSSKLCQWSSTPAQDIPLRVFVNQALNTLTSWGVRGWRTLKSNYLLDLDGQQPTGLDTALIEVCPATAASNFADLWIYDPPYADAVHYHEITEYFIAWLRNNPPSPFDKWNWDSRRPLAIQGKGEKFRSDMVDAFRAMGARMPENGLQVCMFTHQDAGVWADMAQIVWGAGLRVTAAWYVSTETTSELKKGGYVQGTVLLILRKRLGDERAYKDELVLEVRGAVQRQVDLLTGLNQRAKARQRDENPFSDADVQMAGYAAALEVLTGYTHIEGVDMTREALRPRVKGQVGIVEEMIALAVQTATELMRPDGIDESLWERLVPTERFWLKMTEAESNRPAGQPVGKLDDYQNFAKAYRADGWDDLMADRTPNRARLKCAADFKRAMMTGHPFASGLVRPVLYAVNELRMSAEKEEDHAISSERAISGLRDNLKSWAQQRQQAMVIADWLGRALTRHRPAEASAARTLAALIRTERLG
jgi:putative DNA methylase